MTGIKRYTVLALIALGVLVACIDDNFSGCPRPDALTLRIGFENVKPEYAAEVGQMDIFIFDSEGIFHKALSKEGISLTSDFQIPMPLYAGDYRFVVWSDLGGHYLTVPEVFKPGVTTFAEASAMLDIAGGSVIEYDLNTFLYGRRQAKITTDTLLILPLIQNTYKINVTVEGLAKGHDYTVAIADDNGSYYFDNDFAPSGALQYKRGPVSAPEGELSVSLVTLRLDRDRSPGFTLTDNTAHNVLVEEDLVEMILALEDEGIPVDFPTQHEFEARIVYDQATLSATISINGWQIKTGEPEELD
jgi:hypothetical protein